MPTSRTSIAGSRRWRPSSAFTNTTIKLQDPSRQAVMDAIAAARQFRDRAAAIDAADTLAGKSARPRAAAARDRLAPADARSRAAVGERSGQLQQRADEYRLHHDQARVRAARGASAAVWSRERRRCPRRWPRRGRTSRTRRASTPRSPSSRSTATAVSFETAVASAFPTVTDKALLAEFKQANDAVIAALGRVQEMAAGGSAEAIERRIRDRRGHVSEEACGGRDDRAAARRAACHRREGPAEEPGRVHRYGSPHRSEADADAGAGDGAG